MNILITAPSLNESENVSGISTMVKSIVNYDQLSYKFFHFKIGKKDSSKKDLNWVTDQLTLLPRLTKFIRKYKIDAIHLNTDFTRISLLRDCVVFSFLKFFIKKPILLHIHGGSMLISTPKKSSPYRFIIAYILDNSNINVVLSHIEQQQLLNNYNAKSFILPNAIEPANITIESKDFKGEVKFIFLGRIVKAKGIYLIAEALKQLKKYHHQFSFKIYGRGQELTQFLEQLKAMNTLNFEYKGVAKGIEKWQALINADVFLLPSISGEGLPIAMLEAMQVGCVPVVSDDASITTVVENGVNGFVVKKGNQEELISIIKDILNRRMDLNQISNAAKATILEKYNILQYMKSLTFCYSAFNK